jgi:hypothetical protein
MVAPTCFGITLPSSGSVPSAFWEMLNWGAVDKIWMGVLCLVAWCVRTTSLDNTLTLFSCVRICMFISNGLRSFHYLPILIYFFISHRERGNKRKIEMTEINTKNTNCWILYQKYYKFASSSPFRRTNGREQKFIHLFAYTVHEVT